MGTIRITPKDSIQNILDTAPIGALTLVLEQGCYKEKIAVNRKNVNMIGIGEPEIVFSDYHGAIRDEKILSTGDSATFTVAAPDFEAEGIKFTNSYDYKYWHKYKLEHPKEKIDTQAVAFRTVVGATRTILKNCTFSSYQDTVYADVGLHLFEECNIKGCVDFIFGAGEALFDSCTIEALAEGYVTAPSTMTSSEIGFVFNNCNIITSNGSVYLARPWHPSGSVNRTPMTVFANCSFGEHIKKELWCGMNSKRPDGTERYWLPEESRFSIDNDSDLVEKLRKKLNQP